MKWTDDEIVNQITGIRKSNNILWMKLLKLALESNPKKAKEIMRTITKNDREVSKWTGRF
jgi:hypothetical protein